MKIKFSKLFEGLLPELIKPCDNKLSFLKQYNERQTWVFCCWKLLYKCMWVAAACSSVHVLLWVRECSQGLFVGLAIGVHEILYLRTRWWWLGDTLVVEHSHNSHAIQTPLITCFIQFIRTEVDVYFLADWESWPKWRCTVPQTVRAFLTLTFLKLFTFLPLRETACYQNEAVETEPWWHKITVPIGLLKMSLSGK
jgi:hypothetical protein